jgi:hypothetical protein
MANFAGKHEEALPLVAVTVRLTQAGLCGLAINAGLQDD